MTVRPIILDLHQQANPGKHGSFDLSYPSNVIRVNYYLYRYHQQIENLQPEHLPDFKYRYTMAEKEDIRERMNIMVSNVMYIKSALFLNVEKTYEDGRDKEMSEVPIMIPAEGPAPHIGSIITFYGAIIHAIRRDNTNYDFDMSLAERDVIRFRLDRIVKSMERLIFFLQ